MIELAIVKISCEIRQKVSCVNFNLVKEINYLLKPKCLCESDEKMCYFTFPDAPEKVRQEEEESLTE